MMNPNVEPDPQEGELFQCYELQLSKLQEKYNKTVFQTHYNHAVPMPMYLD